MKVKFLLSGFIVLASAVLYAATTLAADVTVTVTNTTHAAYFTPLLISAHSDSERIFELGQPATAEAQAMAEGGNVTGLATLLGGADDDTIVDPAGGLLAPGTSVTTTLNTDTTGNTHLSIAAMILPTNDGFVGLDSMQIPDSAGTYIYPLLAYDAGTEVNDELINAGAGGAPGVPGIPAAPGGDAGENGTGAATTETNATVHVHRGVLGDTDDSGGASDLNSTIHRWLNPVAELIIVVE